MVEVAVAKRGGAVLGSGWAEDPSPKIIFCGPKKSGKTSILRVLFGRVSPHETMYLEPTQGIRLEPASPNRLMNFRLAEVSGNWPWEDSPADYDAALFGRCMSLVCVADAADEAQGQLSHSLALARRVAVRAWRVNPAINVEIFLHKTDRNFRFESDMFSSGPAGFSAHAPGEQKLAFVRDVSNQFSDQLRAAGIAKPEFVCHCTSIFDSTLHEAFSRVVQRSLLKDGRIEQLMDLLVSSSNLDKAFLFDVPSKVHFATDTTPSDPTLLALMQDLLEVVADFSGIYAGNQGGGLDESAGGLIGLNNGQNLYMRLLDDTQLALVCLIREGHCDRLHLLNRNISNFSRALTRTVAK